MIKSRRQQFNDNWSPEKYRQFLSILEAECGGPAQFRQSETPCFFDEALIDRIAYYGVELVDQLRSNTNYREESMTAIPEAYRVPNEPEMPLFVQADFGLDRNLEPKLVEIQGFPSLYAYQPLMAAAYRAAYGIDEELHEYPGQLTADEYQKILGEAILGGQDPENVILLEIDPEHQKTRHDFRMTEKLFGVRSVDIREVRKQGNRLSYYRDGREIPIHRIYNRTIIDELERRGIVIPFDFRDDLQVEWAGHPNWFFRLSKFSIPYFKHISVPRAELLSDVGPLENSERWVLKPLYSFAGAGVIVGPTTEQLDAIPVERRSDYIVQERVEFEPVIRTPEGNTKVEIRIMYIWREGGLQHVNTIVRTGRGSQMGVDFNKGLSWVGASAAFTEKL